jgi:hypothetical protein
MKFEIFLISIVMTVVILAAFGIGYVIGHVRGYSKAEKDHANWMERDGV